jgi:FMNH2-dependent dimethyl sulfone monooxygenase
MDDHFSYAGDYYKIEDTVMQPKPIKKPVIYAGGESEKAKETIARLCDAYVMHGDAPEKVKVRIDDMEARRERLNLPSMIYGVAGYTIVRENEADVKKEIERITDVKQSAAGYGNYQEWLANTKLEQQVSLEDYSVSNRGLRSGLTGTPAQVADKVGEFQRAGVNLLLLQCSPQIEEMERFSEAVIKKSALSNAITT